MQNSFDGSNSDNASYRADKGDTNMQNSFDRGSDLNMSSDYAMDMINPFVQSARVEKNEPLKKDSEQDRFAVIENSPTGGRLLRAISFVNFN
jgi:hypothetical protein